MGGKGEARKEVDKKLAMARQDRNLRTMEPENSQIWIFSRHFLRSWCPFYLCYVFQIHFGSDHLMNIAPTSLSGIVRIWDSEITGRRFCCARELSPSGCALLLVPSPVSTTPEFEVTWVGVWGYVGEVFAALESSHQRSHLPFTHSSGALPWLVSVIDTIFTPNAIHPKVLLWTFSYICKNEKKSYYSCKYKHAPVWKMHLTHVFCPPFTIGQNISLILFEGQ